MRTLITLSVLVAISGCAANSPYDTEHSGQARETAIRIPAEVPPATADTAGRTRGDAGSRIADLALTMVGTPYRYGGESPGTGFDCSGLVYYSFLESGMPVPRTSREQFRSARKISLRDARQGDLLFFADQEKLSHVGIYLGDRRFVHAPSSGRTVSVADLEHPYYQRNLVGVGRLLPY